MTITLKTINGGQASATATVGAGASATVVAGDMVIVIVSAEYDNGTAGHVTSIGDPSGLTYTSRSRHALGDQFTEVWWVVATGAASVHPVAVMDSNFDDAIIFVVVLSGTSLAWDSHSSLPAGGWTNTAVLNSTVSTVSANPYVLFSRGTDHAASLVSLTPSGMATLSSVLNNGATLYEWGEVDSWQPGRALSSDVVGCTISSGFQSSWVVDAVTEPTSVLTSVSGSAGWVTSTIGAAIPAVRTSITATAATWSAAGSAVVVPVLPLAGSAGWVLSRSATASIALPAQGSAFWSFASAGTLLRWEGRADWLVSTTATAEASIVGSASWTWRTSRAPVLVSYAHMGSAAFQASTSGLALAIQPSTRWQLINTMTGVALVLQINPNLGGSPKVSRRITELEPTAAPGTPVLMQGRAEVPSGQFEGVVLTEEQCATLTEWIGGRVPILVVDDLHRQQTIVGTGLTLKRGGRTHSHWRHTYTVTYLQLDRAVA